jgi:hypothetical protein
VFAEENNVEMFAPGIEMSLILSGDEAGEWYREILPKIREVYSGRVAIAEHPYVGMWEVLDSHGAFEGYDCISMTVFPWKKYEDSPWDIRSLEDYREDVKERAEIIDYLAEKYGVECRFVATLGMDVWQGAWPNATIRAEGYEAGLDVLRGYNLTGVFLFHWASEPDHLGDSEEVENMLSRRWTVE